MDSENITEKTSQWIKNSVILKFIGIGILIVVLLIPMGMLRRLIAERYALQKEAIAEISAKWGCRQMVKGPVLTVPYRVLVRTGKGKTYHSTRYAHFLPEKLSVDGELQPKSRYRGIYKAILYSADVNFSGMFAFPEIDPEQIGAEHIMFNKAFVQIGISDMRGIIGNVVLNWGGTPYPAQPGIPTTDISKEGIHIPVNLIKHGRVSEIPFTFRLSLNGSERLSFIPVGKETQVQLSSTWNSPSFDGTFLPRQHEITPRGFTAKWRVLHFNRNFPQSWCGAQYTLESAHCGVSMVTPTGHYHMVTRSVKYSALIIFLTFLLFFMIEIMKKFRVHPFQYLLIGTGLVLFYSLLLSISEQLQFPVAYAIAATGTTVLLSLYTYTIVRRLTHTCIVGGLFAMLYGLLYVILRSEDYALLIGSTGLFLLLGCVMFLTRNFDWYQLNRSDAAANDK